MTTIIQHIDSISAGWWATIILAAIVVVVALLWERVVDGYFYIKDLIARDNDDDNDVPIFGDYHFSEERANDTLMFEIPAKPVMSSSVSSSWNTDVNAPTEPHEFTWEDEYISRAKTPHLYSNTWFADAMADLMAWSANLSNEITFFTDDVVMA